MCVPVVPGRAGGESVSGQKPYKPIKIAYSI